MLAGLHRFDCPVCVQAVGQRNIHSLDVAVSQQILVVAIHARNLEWCGELLGSRQVAAGNRNDRGVFHAEQGWYDRFRRNSGCA